MSDTEAPWWYFIIASLPVATVAICGWFGLFEIGVVAAFSIQSIIHTGTYEMAYDAKDRIN